jgi:predicted Zn-dependent peptidase
MPHVRSVAIGVWLKRGSRHETPAQTGISHFIEHMVFKGTKHRPAEVIAAQVDSIGGHMDAFTAKEYASFHLKVLDEHLPGRGHPGRHRRQPAVRSRGDDQGEEGHLRGDQHGRDTPDDLVMELLTGGVQAEAPAGRPILGTKKSVAGFKRDELAEFFHDVYRPSNILISAAGHLDQQGTAELISRHFGALEPGGAGGQRRTAAARPRRS